MTDNYSNNKKNHKSKKNFFSTFLNQIRNETPISKETLLKTIKDSEINEIIDYDTRNMLEGVMNISKKRVHQIMVPRTKMITLHLNYDLKTCIHTIIRSSHSRYPVMSLDKNYVQGILIAKDLFPFIQKHSSQFKIKNILRPAIVVPESKYVNIMLKEFKSKKSHLSIVIDEFGVVSGLVTIEDILELIVGEIEDEYDTNEILNIHQINKHSFTIPGTMDIEEFNEVFKTHFNNTKVDTIGGLIMKKLGKLPKKGDELSIQGLKFLISIANSRKIIQIQVSFPDEKKILMSKKTASIIQRN